MTNGSQLQASEIGAMAILLRRTQRELESLKAPPAAASGFRHYLGLIRPEVANVAALAAAIHRRDLRAARALLHRMSGHASNQAAAKIGLSVCAREVESTSQPAG